MLEKHANLADDFMLFRHKNALIGVNQQTLGSVVMPLHAAQAFSVFDRDRRAATLNNWPLDSINYNEFIELLVSADGIAGLPQASMMRGRSSPTPDVRILKIVEGCNLACSYCYDGTFSHIKKMSLDMIRKSIEFVFHIRRSDWIHIHFHGGEPLLHWDGVKHGWEVAKKLSSLKNVHTSFAIGTNAVLLDQEKFEWIAANNIALRLSYDGMSNDIHRRNKGGRESSGAVMRSLKMLSDAQSYKYWSVLNTVTRDNVGTMVDFMQFCHDFNVPSVQFQPVRAQGKAAQLKDAAITGAEYAGGILELIRQISKGEFFKIRCETVLNLLRPLLTGEPIQSGCGGTRCGAGSSVLAIDSDGTVGACDTLPRGDVRTLGSVGGDIRDKAELLTRQASVSEKPDCRVCPWLRACNGGCPGSALSDDGDFFSKHKFTCEFSKSIYPEIIILLAESDVLRSYFAYHLGEHLENSDVPMVSN